MNIDEIWNFELRRGNSTSPENGACLMDAVSWFKYGTLGDHPECTCPVIAAFCRNANDAMTDDGRQKLKIFIPRLIGTRDEASEAARAEYLVWQAIRVFTPFWLDKANMGDEAKRLREFVGTMADANRIVSEIKDASAAASAAAYAARAAASASAAASSAAAASAAASASASSEWEPLLLAALDGVLKIGRQAEPIENGRFLTANAAFAKAREVVCVD